MKAIALVLMLGLSVFSFSVYAATNSAANASASQQPMTSQSPAQPVDAPQGPLCSDQTRCDPKYSYCCDVNGSPKCVMKLEDCKNTK